MSPGFLIVIIILFRIILLSPPSQTPLFDPSMSIIIRLSKNDDLLLAINQIDHPTAKLIVEDYKYLDLRNSRICMCMRFDNINWHHVKDIRMSIGLKYIHQQLRIIGNARRLSP